MPTTATLEEKEKILLAYKDVRHQNSETSWLLLHYKDEGTITLHSTGSDYDKFYEHFKNDVRLFGYVRVTHHHGDTKTTKYLFISWVGKDVIKEHKDCVDCDKEVVKTVITEYTYELKYTEEHKLHKNTIEDICKTEVKEKEVVKVK